MLRKTCFVFLPFLTLTLGLPASASEVVNLARLVLTGKRLSLERPRAPQASGQLLKEAAKLPEQPGEEGVGLANIALSQPRPI